MKTRRALTALCALLLLFAAFPARTFAYNYANIDVPPAITVVTYDAPEDLELQAEVQKNGESILADPTVVRRAWETRFQLYREEIFRAKSFRGNDKDFAGTVLLCRSGGEEHRIPIPQECLTPGGNRDVMTLECGSWTLRAGVPDWRAPASVAERVALILAARALCPLLMRYRKLRSWLSFLGVSLLTQIPLNIGLKNAMVVDGFAMQSKVFLGSMLVILALILSLETVLMTFLVKEYDRDRTTSCVVGVNVLGIFAMIAALILLPA